MVGCGSPEGGEIGSPKQSTWARTGMREGRMQVGPERRKVLGSSEGWGVGETDIVCGERVDGEDCDQSHQRGGNGRRVGPERCFAFVGTASATFTRAMTKNNRTSQQ